MLIFTLPKETKTYIKNPFITGWEKKEHMLMGVQRSITFLDSNMAIFTQIHIPFGQTILLLGILCPKSYYQNTNIKTGLFK